MKPSDAVARILGERQGNLPRGGAVATAFAPSNIALCKYWGKRNVRLNLPVTASLSVGLREYGSKISLSLQEGPADRVELNGQPVLPGSAFYRRFAGFLNLFRVKSEKGAWPVFAGIHMNLPVGAGLASSACGFAALIQALNQWLDWQLDETALSILARFGSGSACRSLWPGFVEWQAGVREDGMDSHGIPLEVVWPDLCIGLLVLSAAEKPVSSREAMLRTVETSRLYQQWPARVAQDLEKIRQAIWEKDFVLLGETAEVNAMMMHATMRAAQPPVDYALASTAAAIEKIRRLRAEGLLLYFTQDAGPNLKLLYCRQDRPIVEAHFPAVVTVLPFAG